MEYISEGHTYQEAKKVFKAGITAIKRWKKLLSEKKSLENSKLNRKPRKFDSDKLRVYVEEHPLATLEEIAKHFGGSITGAFDALKREKITLKKRLPHTANAMKKNAKNSMRN